ncbi:MAG: ATP-binding cassette domain-containing protein [Verrucomicrobiota bacterium]
MPLQPDGFLNTVRGLDEGSIAVFGADVSGFGAARLRKLRSRIAFIPQQLGLVSNVSVLQNVIMGKGGQRGTLRSLRDMLVPSKADVDAIHALLERVGIGEKIYDRVDRLSGGQQQRVAIARALFQEPAVILADEPVSSVDPARARDTLGLLCELSEEQKRTLCVSLHHPELALEFFPRVLGLRDGRAFFDAAADAISESQLESLYELEQGKEPRSA